MSNTIYVEPIGFMAKTIVQERQLAPNNYRTAEDKRDVSEICNELRSSNARTSEETLMDLAKKLVSAERYNAKLTRHEEKVQNIIDIILSGTKVGESFGRELLLDNLYHYGMTGEGKNGRGNTTRPVGALSKALYRLEKNGIIVRKSVNTFIGTYTHHIDHDKTIYTRIR